jgi:hypothetical protein
LMTNNFFRFYPHPEQRYQEYAGLIPQYCEALFPGYYDPARGVLDFGHAYQKLRGDVAPITDQEREGSAAIRFFEQCNPEWQRGTELPCVGRAGFSDAFRYLFRYLGKVWRRPRATPVPAAVAEAEATEPQERVEVPVRVVKKPPQRTRSDKDAMPVAARSAR